MFGIPCGVPSSSEDVIGIDIDASLDSENDDSHVEMTSLPRLETWFVSTL